MENVRENIVIVDLVSLPADVVFNLAECCIRI